MTETRKRAARLAFGSIVEDKRTRRFTIRYTVQTPSGPKRMTGGRVSFRTKTEARQRLADIESELRRGTWKDPDASKGPLLSEYAPPWIASRRSSKTKKPLAVRTRELYEDLFRLHIDPFLGHLRLAEITVDHVREWNDHRAAAVPTRARQAYSMLRSMMTTAVDARIIANSPCTIAGAGSNVPRSSTYTRRGDVRRLLDAVPHYLRLPLEVSAACHVRQGELLALQRRDVDLEREELHVVRAFSRPRGGELLGGTKSRETRKLTIPPETMEKLRAHLGTDPHSRPDE